MHDAWQKTPPQPSKPREPPPLLQAPLASANGISDALPRGRGSRGSPETRVELPTDFCPRRLEGNPLLHVYLSG